MNRIEQNVWLGLTASLLAGNNDKCISTGAGDRAGANHGKILFGLNDTNAMATLTIGKDIIEPNTNYQAQNDYKR